MVRRGVAWCALALLLTGCVADNKGTDFSTVIQQIGPPRAGQSRIVVIRDDGGLGLLVGWDIKLDGAPLPSLRTGTFIYADRPAGPHLLSASETMFPDETKTKISTAPGRTFFFIMRMSDRAQKLMGAQMAGGLVGLAIGAAATSDSVNPGPYDFRPVEEAQARSMIAGLRLAE